MGKHSASKPATRGSLKHLFSRRKASAGRHSEPVSAAGVLASGRRAPVMAAIAIPTAAIATIAVAGVVNNGQGESNADVEAQANAHDYYEPDFALPQGESEQVTEVKKHEEEAKKQNKASKASVKMDAPKEEPEESASGSSSSAGSSSSSKSSKSSGGKGTSADDSNKPHNKKASGQGGTCKASMYGNGDGTHGGPTASGERFNANAMTAAHKTLPMNSRVKVTNKANGKTAVVRINDRGPYIGGRCLDLSVAAMKAVGGYSSGVISVSYEVL